MIVFIISITILLAFFVWHVYGRITKENSSDFHVTDARVMVYDFVGRKHPGKVEVSTLMMNGNSPIYLPTKHTKKTYGAQQREARKRRKSKNR